MALGSPSGKRIINAVLVAIIGPIDFDMPLQEAIEVPGFHCSGDEFEIEPRIPKEIRNPLEEKGPKLIVKKDGTPGSGRSRR